MPRPSSHGRRTPVIPAGWADAAAPTIGDTIALSGCTVKIGPAGGAPAWNPTAKQTETPVVPPVYDGPATVTVISDSDREAQVVDQDTHTRLYEVRLPLDHAGDPDPVATPVEIGHVITVTANPDPQLVDARMVVQQIERDTRRFSRLLYAVLTD